VRTVFDRGTRVATRDNPPSKALYERLLAAGKVKKVALTACMPTLLTMLNAMLKHRTPWQPQEVQNSKIYQVPLTIKTVAPLLRRCAP
jgi:transposase